MPAYMSGKNKAEDYFPTAGNGQNRQFDMSQIFNQQNQQLQNIRSPMVRRNMSGQVVDENAPTGLGWLTQNGPNRPDQLQNNHSWDQPGVGQSYLDPGLQARLAALQGPRMQQTDVGQFMQTPYGPVMSGGPRMEESTGPFLAAERNDIGNQLASAGAGARPMPRITGQEKQTSVPQQKAPISETNAQKLYKPSQEEAAKKFKSKGVAEKESAKRQARISSGEIPPDYYTNPNSQFNKVPNDGNPFQPQGKMSPEVHSANQALDAVYGDEPAIVPEIMRMLQVGGARSLDQIANLLFRSKADQGYPITNQTSSRLLKR